MFEADNFDENKGVEQKDLHMTVIFFSYNIDGT